MHQQSSDSSWAADSWAVQVSMAVLPPLACQDIRGKGTHSIPIPTTHVCRFGWRAWKGSADSVCGSIVVSTIARIGQTLLIIPKSTISKYIGNAPPPTHYDTRPPS